MSTPSTPSTDATSPTTPSTAAAAAHSASSAAAAPLRGVVPPLCTPLTPSGALDTRSLRALVHHLLAAGVHGLFVAGSTGEAAVLDDEVRHAAIRTTVEAADGRVPVLAGVLDTGTARVLDHARAAHLVSDRGDALVALVQGTDGAVRAHVEGLLEGAPGAVAGVGRPVEGIDAVPHSLRDAQLAVSRLALEPQDGTPGDDEVHHVLATLTPREREVLALLAAGRSNGEIAERLFISPKTASVHVTNIKDKLGVENRVEAATLATRLGIALDGDLEN